MPTVTTGDGVDIYYKDWGSGQPVVFSHGWPLTADAWDGSANFVAAHGFRAVAHDREGDLQPESGRGHSALRQAVRARRELFCLAAPT